MRAFMTCLGLMAVLTSSHSADPAVVHVDTVVLVAGERVPYIGPALPDDGYAGEVAREALGRSGYNVRIDFYPLARARLLTQRGLVDGMLPVPGFLAEDKSTGSAFAYSVPFPGDTIGLLKKKALPFSYDAKDLLHPDSLLQSLQALRLGSVLGGPALPLLDDDPSLQLEMVSKDLHNLDKLAADRIHLALIDKYTAADLMATRRPHLIGQFEFLTPPLARRSFRVAFSKRAPRQQQLLAAFNRGLREMERDGSLQRIRAKHGLFAPRPVAADDTRKTRLVIGTVNNRDMHILRDQSVHYQRRYPHVEFEWRILDENTLRLRQLSDLAISDGQFDVMTIGSYEAPVWAQRNWILPLRPPKEYDLPDVLATVRKVVSHRGSLYALPFYAESSMTYYRKDLFASAGLVMPARPTYDDIRRFAARLHAPENGVYGICLRGKPGWGENMAFVTTLVNAHGGRWFDEEWRPQLDSPEWQHALSYYRHLLLNYGPPHAERNGFNENLELFSAGRCAIWIDATVAAGALFDREQSKVAGHLGFAAAPHAVTEKGTAWLWVWALAVPSSSTQKPEALRFIAWATSRSYIESVAERHGWLSIPPGTRASTYANENYLRAAPFARFVREAVEQADVVNSTLAAKPYIGIQYVGILEFPAIGTYVGQEVALALRGEATVATVLSRAQHWLAQQMRVSGYPARAPAHLPQPAPVATAEPDPP